MYTPLPCDTPAVVWVIVAFRGGTSMCGRWGCIPADRRTVVSGGQLVICGSCSLLCTPGVAAGGVAQLAVGKQVGVCLER